MNIYIGGPLFSYSEQLFNKELSDRIIDEFGDKVNLYVPQDNMDINDKSLYASSIDIFEGDMAHLKETDILIANLDGIVIDPGLAAEIGYFYTLERPILSIYTDMRQGTHDNEEKIKALDEVGESQFSYANLFVVGAVKKRGRISQSIDELLQELRILLGETNEA